MKSNNFIYLKEILMVFGRKCNGYVFSMCLIYNTLWKEKKNYVFSFLSHIGFHVEHDKVEILIALNALVLLHANWLLNEAIIPHISVHAATDVPGFIWLGQ